MASQQFDLVTNWHFNAPVEKVWTELNAPDDWPVWWRAVERVQMLAAGDASGIGAVRRFTWRTALPYALTFDMTATRIEPMTMLEGRASGELDGVGLWTLVPTESGTDVRYNWRIEVTKPWMRAMAPLLKPAFRWNHNQVMAWGYHGLTRRLTQ
jgi:hypothetical protein